MEHVLELRDIAKIYPGTTALSKVNLAVRKGEVHGLIGKNGAGKSTLVGIIAGIVQPTSGEILLNGQPHASFSRIESRKEKIAIVPQEPQIVLENSVAENLFMPDYIKKYGMVDWRALQQKSEEIITRAGLTIKANQKAIDLTISERQLILVLKACYVENAQIIILDEASASLSNKDQKILYDIIADCKSQGKTILFISHRTEELMDVCDRVTVIRDGYSVVTKNCDELSSEEFASLIVGQGFSFHTYQSTSNREFTDQDALLTIQNFTRYGAYDSISFTLHKGEILGIAGIRGSGRTELLKGIAGIEPPHSGHLVFQGKKTVFRSSSRSFKAGISYLPEDREHEGLISSASVRHNLELNSLQKISHRYFISSKAETHHTEDLIKRFDVKTSTIDQEMSQLSGGNKQKVIVARIAAGEPLVYLLDEPTRGVDIAAKDSILGIIKEKLHPEVGVIITAPGLEDLLLICDRILVLRKGVIVGEHLRNQVSEHELFQQIQG